MAKHVLNTGDEAFDFVLIGMSSSEDQYGLVAILDRALNTSFYLGDYIPFNLKEGRVFRFSLFRFLDDELGLDLNLICNVSNYEESKPGEQAGDLFSGHAVDERVRLIKELPKTDYFLLLKGEDLVNYQYKIIEKLKHCPEIQQIQAIEPEQLPSRKNLIF